MYAENGIPILIKEAYRNVEREKYILDKIYLPT